MQRWWPFVWMGVGALGCWHTAGLWCGLVVSRPLLSTGMGNFRRRQPTVVFLLEKKVLGFRERNANTASRKDKIICSYLHTKMDFGLAQLGLLLSLPVQPVPLPAAAGAP